MTASRLLELQAAGKLPAPIPAQVLRRQLQLLKGHSRPLVKITKSCTTAVWASAYYVSYLIGVDSSLKNVCRSIDLYKQGFEEPGAIKVDGSRNVWVPDVQEGSTITGGAVEEFDSAAVLKATYTWSHCLSVFESCYGYGFDAAENSTNVFATVADWNSYSPSESDYGTGFEVFTKADPSGAATYIPVADHASGTSCAPVCDVDYADVDNSGNLWFDFYGDGNASCDGAGLGEVTNPTSSPKVTIVFPPCTYQNAGGVYVSGGGKVLNVTDQETRVTYQYHLPVTSSSKPFHKLGPTRTDLEGLGDPVAGGFNAGETQMVIADGYGWYDLGAVPTNKWKDVATLDCPSFLDSGCLGAAFTPSDK